MLPSEKAILLPSQERCKLPIAKAAVFNVENGSCPKMSANGGIVSASGQLQMAMPELSPQTDDGKVFAPDQRGQLVQFEDSRRAG